MIEQTKSWKNTFHHLFWKIEISSLKRFNFVYKESFNCFRIWSNTVHRDSFSKDFQFIWFISSHLLFCFSANTFANSLCFFIVLECINEYYLYYNFIWWDYILCPQNIFCQKQFIPKYLMCFWTFFQIKINYKATKYNCSINFFYKFHWPIFTTHTGVLLILFDWYNSIMKYVGHK